MKTGIDIVEVKRIEKICKKKGFLQKIFTKTENEYIKSKTGTDPETGMAKIPYNTIAGLFAAKEAVSKALGVGFLNGLGFFDIEIDHEKLGAPIVKLSNNAQKCVSMKINSIALSISHDGGFAISICNID